MEKVGNTKKEKIEYLAKVMDVDPSNFEHMNIAELSAQVRAYQDEQRKHAEAEAASPIIRPDEREMGLGPSIRDGDAGDRRVKLDDENDCAVDEIVAYKGTDTHRITKAHQTTIVNPNTGHPGIVTFEVRPEIWKDHPVAIVRDWRVRAQVLFQAQVVVTNPTLGHQQVRVLPKPDYFIPLDMHPNKAAIERMANYVRGQLQVEDETERLTKAVLGN